MYQIGEKIVYPMHGAGTVQSIEEKEVLGEYHKYYILKIPSAEMKLMVPVETAESIGVRPIINLSQLDDVYKRVSEETEEDCANWNKRYRDNLSKIKSGDIVQIAKVVKSLSKREIKKPLSTCEKKLLTNARQILASELILVTNESKDNVEQKIDEMISC